VLKLCEDQATENLDRALLASWQAPDLLGIGVAVCDASGRLLIANQTAIDVLRAQDGLRLSSDGRICESEEGAHMVTDIVRRCAIEFRSAQKAADGCVSINIRRTSGKAPLTLLARPFRPPATRGSASMTLIILLNSTRRREEAGIGPLMRFAGSEDSVGNRTYREDLQ
jgi:hypothetical protein